MPAVNTRRVTPDNSRPSVALANRAASSLTPSQPGEGLIFRSAPYLKTIERITRFARNPNVAILLEGESGTGKTCLARQIHALSPRNSAPFESVPLSAMDDNLAGSQLFGHVAGAFTDARQSRHGHFVTAQGGTLFLDEIGKASLAVQQKLLTAIEERVIRPLGTERDVRVDIRIIAASNVPLDKLAAEGRFLPDLYARLCAFRVQLPPLHARKADIPILVEYYVDRLAGQCGYEQAPDIDDALMEALKGAEWPNNLRQLSSTMHRVLIEADGASVLTLDHCHDDLEYLRALDSAKPAPLTASTIDEAIARAGGSMSAAARLLGVDRTTVYRAKRRLASAN